MSKVNAASPKGNQSWIFIGRTDAEAEAPICWLPDVKSRLTGQNLDAGKDWGRRRRGRQRMRWLRGYHQLSGYEFEQTPGDGEGQGSLVCSRGHKESDMCDHGVIKSQGHDLVMNNNVSKRNYCFWWQTMESSQWRDCHSMDSLWGIAVVNFMCQLGYGNSCFLN